MSEIPEGFKKQKVCHDDSTPPYDSYCSFCSGSKNCYSEEFRIVKMSEPDEIHIETIARQKELADHAREMSIGFDFWKCTNYEPVEEGNYQGLYCYKFMGDNIFYTPAELYTKYLETLNKKV